MSFARSARLPSGSGGNSARVSVILLAVCIGLLGVHPAKARSQTAVAVPPLSFRRRLELQVLGEASKDLVHAPSLRITLQRRHSLTRSTILSGMLLLDPLSRSEGLALGQMLTFPKRNGLIEPFLEAGVAHSDARLPDGTYMVAGTGGGGSQLIHRYQIVQGPAGLVGGGVSWSTVMTHAQQPVRFTVGYWQLLGTDGFQHGSVRFGVSLALRGGRDARWYTLQHDRTPPRAVVLSHGLPEGDTLLVAGGTIRVVAQDAHGIARIRINRKDVGFEPADPASVADLGFGDGAVVARVELPRPFAGRPLNVEVRDSAGLSARSALWTYPAPDRTPPDVVVLDRSETSDALHGRAYARVDDPSGVADARIGVCPARLAQPSADRRDAGSGEMTRRVVMGWSAPGSAQELEVRDRLGNVARVSLPSTTPEIPQDAPSPTLTKLTATVGSKNAYYTSVRVGGIAVDPARRWIIQVTVDGKPAVLRVASAPSSVAFDGWLLVDPAASTVSVVATTDDGRTVRTEVPITAGARPERGRLYTLFVLPKSQSGLSPSMRALVGRAGDDDPTVLYGSQATPSAVLNALSELQKRVGPGDAVMVYMEGRMAGDLEAAGPSVELGNGRLDLARVGHLLRALQSGVTLVSTSFEAGDSWSVLPSDVPGAQPPADCYDDGAHPAGTVVDARPASPERMLVGLTGAADADRDGRVVTSEVLSYLGVSPPVGLLDFDPLLTVGTAGGAR